MKLLHLFLALFTATFFLACSSDKEQLQVDTNLTTYSEDMVALQASGALAYSWRQLSGTPVVLINAHSDTASFIAPSVSTEETLVFELEAVTVQIQEKNITLKKQVQVTVHPKAVVDTGSTSGEAEQEEPQEEVAEAGDTDMNSTSQEAEPEEVEQEQVSSTDMNSTSGEVEPEEQEKLYLVSQMNTLQGTFLDFNADSITSNIDDTLVKNLVTAIYNDTLNADIYNNSGIYSNNALIVGNDTDEVIDIKATSATVLAGKGDDRIYASTGNNTYIYRTGDGADTLNFSNISSENTSTCQNNLIANNNLHVDMKEVA